MKYRSISHSLYTIARKINLLFGVRNYIFAYWWGVQIGKNNKFVGYCRFQRYPNTSIRIGNNCTFLSKTSSNQLGPNHFCVITTSAYDVPASIEIGNNCGFSGTSIAAFKFIKIGNNVRCGTNTTIADADFHLDDPRAGKPADVIIEDNVWLGANVTVLKGVTIGENTVIGAGSVVTKSIPANVVAAGNPCKVIKNLSKPI
jgi:acetyltransferase-like isoleucine patch superfamily enzyme